MMVKNPKKKDTMQFSINICKSLKSLEARKLNRIADRVKETAFKKARSGGGILSYVKDGVVVEERIAGAGK